MPESKNFCANFLAMDFDGIWHKVETCWSDEPNILFTLFEQHSRERTLCWLVCRHLKTDFFKLGVMIETTKLYIVIPVWMTLAFIQGHSCVTCEHFPHPFSCKFLNQFE